MRTLLVAMLILAAPAALAAHDSTYAPAWDKRPPPAWGTRQLAGEARQLDQAALRLYSDIRSHTGRSELSSRARQLAEATRDFRHLAERGASMQQLHAGLQRVNHQHAYLEQRLDSRERQYRLRYALAGLDQVDQAIRRTSSTLQRHANDSRGDRYPDRYVHHPRYPQGDRRNDRDDRWTRDQPDLRSH